MRLKQIKPIRLFHVKFKDHIEACLTLLRIQEFYESPKFRNKMFFLDDYIDWWCRREEDNPFDYMNEVGGYNFPGDILIDWIKKYAMAQHCCASDREFAFLDKLVDKGIIDYQDIHDGRQRTDFYIIATYGNTTDEQGYLAHEIRHALFYLLPEYRDGILEVLSRLPCKRLRAKLLKDYGKNVLDDEIQAYALTGFDPYYQCKISELPQELQMLRRELKKVERRFIKKGKIHVPRDS